MNGLYNIDELLNGFVETWGDFGHESNGSYSVTIRQASQTEINQIIDDVEELSDLIETDHLVFSIGGRDDEYRIRYNPNRGAINSDRISGEYEIESQYSHDENLIEYLQTIEANSLSDESELRVALEATLDEEDLQVDVEYNLQKENIISRIQQEIPGDHITIRFHFFQDNFSSKILQTPPRNIREYLLEEDDIKSLVIILDINYVIPGTDFSMSGLAELHDDLGIFNQTSRWQTEYNKILTQSLIEDPNTNFLPPSFFHGEFSSDGDDIEEIERLWYRYIVFFSLLSIFSSSEHIGSGTWDLRMTGRQYIEGKIQVSEPSRITLITTERESTIELSQDIVENIFSVYEWVYTSDESEERINILRNVITLFARDIEDILVNSKRILGSAKANRQYFLEQSIDDFFEFRQELMQGAFRTQRAFSELRGDLMQDLTRDLFRTFGFILVLAASLVFELGTIIPIGTVYNLISGLLIIFGFITLRRIGGIRRNFYAVLDNRNNSVEFYQKFFDERELKDMGIITTGEVPWLCRVLSSERFGVIDSQMKCNFTIDILLYYALAGGIIVGSLLIIIDVNFVDIISQLPPMPN